jgi:hypothetical protein
VQEEFLLSQVRRCNRNLLLVNLFILFAVILIAVFSYNYFYNTLCGPFEMDAASVTAITNLKAQIHTYITVAGDDVGHTGLQYYEVTYEEGSNKVVNTKVIADYLYLFVHGKLLVVKAPPGATDFSYTGWLKEMPAEVKSELLSLAEEEDIPAMAFNQIVLPFLLDTQVNRAEGYVALFALAPFFLISSWNLLRYGQRVADPSSHPIYKKLAAFGKPESVAKDIDNDISGSGIPMPQGITISDGWFVKKKFFGLSLVPLPDVLWMYKHVTKHTINFIPVGKTYCLTFHLKNRAILHINMRERIADAAAEVILEKAPGIIFGHTGELAVLWNQSHRFSRCDRESKDTESSAGAIGWAPAHV